MTLRYDASGLDPSVIGDTLGVSETDRRQLDGRLDDAVDQLRQAHAGGELGFIDCPNAHADTYTEWARQKISQGFTDQVVIGIGGSSLGARAVLASRPTPADTGLRTHFAENIDPVGLARLFGSIDIATTIFVVVTKSGSTIETMSKFWYAWDQTCQQLGDDQAAGHFVAVTGPSNDGLRAIADTHGFDSFEVPTNVGGRFSVLTAVGLVPLALAGYDIDALLAGAGRARQSATAGPAGQNPMRRVAADIISLYERGVDQFVMMAYSDQLLALADWFRQLWAESLGKAHNRRGEAVHTGMTPIKALGPIDQHSQVQLYMEGPPDKWVMFLEVGAFDRRIDVPQRSGLPDSLAHLGGQSMGDILRAELQGTRRALQQAGRPTSTWRFERVQAADIGAFIFAWEFITALTGELLDINAFDQPGVELGKKMAHGLLGRQGFDKWASLASADHDDGAGMSIG